MKHFLIQNPPNLNFRAYKKFGGQIFRRCVSLAKNIKGLEITHINSTSAGGGVAELLKNQVPLEKSLEMRSRWLVLREPRQFFFITKKIHNLLQGQKGFLSEPEKNYFLDRLAKPGQELKKILGQNSGRQVVVLHDPQVLPLINFLPLSASVIARLHIDLSVANKSVLEFLRPFLEKADKTVLSHRLYRPSWLSRNKTAISCPAINPFSEKNREISSKETLRKFKHFGINPSRPTISQISRFDPWKDPEGVIQAYYLAKKKLPGLQLILEGAMEAKDDPQAAGIYSQLKMEYQNDTDIIFHGSKNLPDSAYQLWINALQRQSTVVIQKSLREGFGLTVTEALWKGKAVIGGNAAGIRLQIKNGRNGFIASSPAECAEQIVRLINNQELARRLGRRGRETVRKNFLFNRLILDFLQLYNDTADKSVSV